MVYLLIMKRVIVNAIIMAAGIIVYGKEYIEPTDISASGRSEWPECVRALDVRWVSKDVHHRQFVAPQSGGAVDTVVKCWRGERIGVEALIAACDGVDGLAVKLKGEKWGEASFMRYVLTTAYNICGYPSDTLPTYTVADMIDMPGAIVDMPAHSVRPVWVSMEVPRDASVGLHKFELVVEQNGKEAGKLSLAVDVSERTLPEPKDYSFYLDLWQQPYAVSRYYGVEPWSEEHFEKLKPYARMLGRAGQKAVSVILFYEPWGEQSHDKFLPMVETRLTKKGKWEYDYTILDKYVEFMEQNGVVGDIECFTMIPWDMEFRYYDEASKGYKTIKTTSDSREYEDLWTNFLRSLNEHVKSKGWADRMVIVMDERGLGEILNARKVARASVPDIRLALAGNYHGELAEDLDIYTLLVGDWFPKKVMDRRKAKGYKTLIYTCCANVSPNIFSNSQPADAAYLAPYATATGWDGYLHWSFMNWTDNPLEDSRFRMFAPGDTFFVYPDGRSSIRYERMLEGIQLSEKIHILRQEALMSGDVERVKELDAALLPLVTGARVNQTATSQIVNDLNEAIAEL